MRTRIMLAAALVAAATAACGDDGGSGDGGPATLDPQAAAVAWADCMRENGIDIPDPEAQGGDTGGGEIEFNIGAGGPPGTDPKAWEKAKEACKKYAEDMGGDIGEEMSEEAKQQMLDYAECMRDKGVDMPDPDLNGGDGEVGLTIPDDPNYESAHAECSDLLPEGL